MEWGKVRAGHLSPEQFRDNFADLHPPLDAHEAAVESDRCYFCYDAPCVTACPTTIDIPMFIRQIANGNPLGAAKTIFDQNIFGGMCARVCPTETLCEQACVRESAEGKPVRIGLLQRFATDTAMERQRQFYTRAAPTGRKVAVVGAGPAGLACAHRLAMLGHEVIVFEAREKAGGLNEYGIAAYKTVDNFAQREAGYILAIGGIDIRYGCRLGRDIHLDQLLRDHDAVFLAIGLGGVNRLDLENEDAANVEDAVDWIARLRQAADRGSIPVGDQVVVIGGGMTAIDAAVQAKALGARHVTICYRGPRERMKASPYEQEIALTRGVVLECGIVPVRIHTQADLVSAVEFNRNGETILLPCDQLFKAIGQRLDPYLISAAGLGAIANGRIATDEHGRTALAKLWAGGDCIEHGEDLTVTAAAQGRDAALSIHAALTREPGDG